MLGPYRTLGSVPPDAAARCTAISIRPRCGAFPPHPPRFPASIASPAPAPHSLPTVAIRAIAAAATAFLLAATASLAAVTYTAVEQQMGYRHVSTAVQSAAPQRRSASTAASTAPLAILGAETHAPEELWQRAVRLALEGADVTLASAALPRAVSTSRDAGAITVVPVPELGGLRVTSVAEGSAADLAGVRRGDLVTAVNGFALGSPPEGSRAFDAVLEARALVAEVWRDGHRVVLRVGWTD